MGWLCNDSNAPCVLTQILLGVAPDEGLVLTFHSLESQNSWGRAMTAFVIDKMCDSHMQEGTVVSEHKCGPKVPPY